MQSNLERFTDRFAQSLIEAIEAGVAPWQKPWKPGERITAFNALTGHRYRGSNLVMLVTTQAIRRYDDPRWAGAAQIKNAGGYVRAGETGTPVLVWKTTTKTPDTNKDEKNGETPEPPERKLFYRMKHVFNIAQAEGLNLPVLEMREPAADWSASGTVQKLVEHAEVNLTHGPDRACYNIVTDTIEMPHTGRFEARNAYEHTLIHELAHATAHPTRLDRADAFGNSMKSREYAIEELRAEISAMLTGERIGIGHEPQHGQSYVAHWVGHLQSDPNTIRKATADAQKITDWLTRNLDTESQLTTAA